MSSRWWHRLFWTLENLWGDHWPFYGQDGSVKILEHGGEAEVRPTEKEIVHIRRLWRVTTLWERRFSPQTGATPHQEGPPPTAPSLRFLQLWRHPGWTFSSPGIVECFSGGLLASHFIWIVGQSVKSEHWASGSDGRQWGLQHQRSNFGKPSAYGNSAWVHYRGTTYLQGHWWPSLSRELHQGVGLPDSRI